MTTTSEAIRLARKHIGSGEMVSSARLALADAISLEAEGKLDLAKDRALDSLAYSVGVFHADYKRIAG